MLPVSVLAEPARVDGSLYEYLDTKRNAPVRAIQHIRALNAPPELARRLRIPTARAVLFVTRIGFAASGRPMELTHSYCRDEYFDLVAELRRDA